MTGLIGPGREAFERVVADPDELADVPTVPAVAAGQLNAGVLNGESIQFAAARAYDRHAEDPDSFWDELQAVPPAAGMDGQLPDERWDGRFGGPDDRVRIPWRLPRLAAQFGVTTAG